MQSWEWVAEMLQAPPSSSSTSGVPRPGLGLVLLNTPLSCRRLERLWAAAERRVVADGAANRLLARHPDLTPDVVLGDFDSVEKATIAAYEARGVEIRDLSEDQDTTDVEKALAFAEAAGCRQVVLAGQYAGVDGRLDHTFGLVNALFRAPKMEVAVLGDDSLLLLLRPGRHRLAVPSAAEAPHCGLVPICGVCERITTTGLRWDMTDATMEFGGLVSTSNRVDPASGGVVTVETSHPVLWMCTLQGGDAE